MYLPRSTLETRLAAAPRADRVAFWADVWRARGAEVTETADGLLVSHADGERERIAVDPPSLAALAEDPPDRLLSHAPTAPPPGVVQIGADERHRLALYGVDRETLAALLDRHLDASLAALGTEERTADPPPVETRRDRPTFGGGGDRGATPAGAPGSDGSVPDDAPLLVDDDASPSTDWRRDHRTEPRDPDQADTRGLGGPVSLRTPLLAALTVALVLVAVVAGLPGVAPGDDPGADDDAAQFGPGSDAVADPYPVGLSADGVTDAAALARRHGDAVDGQSYTLVTRFSGIDDPPPPAGAWERGRRVVSVETRRVYRERIEGTLADGRRIERASYADGETEYVRAQGADGPTYWRSRISVRSDGDGLFTARAEGYVARYLAAPNATVSTINESADERRYRVRATGAPPALPGAENYTAVAVVTERGLVESLTVRYRPEPGAATVTFRMRYEGVGSTQVSAPPWYDAAREAVGPQGTTNATTTA